MRNVLITGAAGFFGRYFTEKLRDRGDAVWQTDLVWGQDVRNIWEWAPPVELDLVIHLAGNVGGRVAIDQSPLWIGQNLAIDATFFEWAAKYKPGRVVYFSSAASYPIALQARGYRNQLNEEMLCHSQVQTPDSLYGWAKVTGERLSAELRKAGVPVTVVRPFSGYGPEQTMDYPFSCFIARALARETPFTIWGDGTQCRDWVHADDVIGAVLAAVDAEVDGPFNACTGRATSFLELAGIVKELARHEGEGDLLPLSEWPNDLRLGAPTGPHFRVGDPSLLHTFYKPLVTVEEGVERALRGERVP